MDYYAVLTGDIVSSRSILDRTRLLGALEEALEVATAKYGGEYHLYRGDSFQLLLHSPGAAAWAALLIRAKLISHSANKKERWDARISIGIGEIAYKGNHISTSDGEAFHLSGETGLAALEKKRNRLIICTPWQTSERTISLLTKFVDDIVSHWSQYSAEVAYHYLLDKPSQMQLAEILGKSQSTINGRIATSKIELINEYIQHVKEHINWESRP